MKTILLKADKIGFYETQLRFDWLQSLYNKNKLISIKIFLIKKFTKFFDGGLKYLLTSRGIGVNKTWIVEQYAQKQLTLFSEFV